MLFQKTISKANSPWMKSKQAGLSLESFVFYLVVAAIAIVAIITAYNKSMNGARVNRAVTETGIIIAAASSWGGNDKTGINMSKLCTGGYLTPEICGTANNGATGNPWGGPYEITTDTNTSRVKITLKKIDKSVVTSVGDALAKLSFDSCKLLENCATANKTENDTIYIIR
ncbi:hypothetical protein QMU85_002060 [Photobacterium damselae]|nr:hypothetical protein [Photobacterium damselae]